MQATNEFNYDASKDFEQPGRWRKVLYTILIAITILSYGIEVLDPTIEVSGWRFALYMAIILSGLALLLFPPLRFNPFVRKGSSYVTLQDGLLHWNLGGKVESISLDDVNKMTRLPSQIQFVMKDGTIKIMDFYKMANKQKVHEFLEVLQRHFS